MLVLGISTAKAQDSYTAKNGRTYKLGDTIQLGKGTGQNGAFLFFRQKLLVDTGEPQAHTVKFTNVKMVLKQIKTRSEYGASRVYFIVNPYRYNIDIENAIEAKEVLN